MGEAAHFLTALAQAAATMTLYRPGHPARERAIDAAYQALLDLQARLPKPLFTFLGDEIVCGRQPVRELKTWDWSRRLAEAGIQRLEFEADVTRDEFEAFLDEVVIRLGLPGASTAESRQMRGGGIRFGAVGLRGEVPDLPETVGPGAAYTLVEEAETVRWLHERVQQERVLPLGEAEAVVRSLSVAMHAERDMLLPLLELRSFDEYTTTHSMNVSVLAMAFAEQLGLGGRDVRAFGVAGLLHDIGKVRIPLEILTKPGRLSDEERAVMNQHPVDGARLILASHDTLDLAAVVAYEHHIMLDGGGYPRLRFPRGCHFASHVVHLCDVYDALRTRRPYRDAWPAEKVLDYVAERGGTEFEPSLAAQFVRMMRVQEGRIARFREDGRQVRREAVVDGGSGSGTSAG
jgi:putative nucleotidyltransferase with HDIG domain